MDITPQLINTIKSNFGKQKGVRGRKGGRRRARINGAAVTLEELLAAKKLAEAVGGIPRAQEALAALLQLT